MDWCSIRYCEYNQVSLILFLFLFQGGPCGVLACIQAYIIKDVLFADDDDGHDKADDAM